MRLLFTFFLLVVSCLTIPTRAQEEHLTELRTGAEAHGWDGVGRVVVGGKLSCTGALIEPDLVLTAAHCVIPKGSRTVAVPETVEFLAGFRNGRATAERVAIDIVAHPDFVLGPDGTAKNIGDDVALVRLKSPISNHNVIPFELGDRPRKGAHVNLISYGKTRLNSPVLQHDCRVLARWSVVLVLNCGVEKGSSGAPVLAIDGTGEARIVSVISSGANIRGQAVSLGTGLTKQVALLRDLLSQGGREDTNKSLPNLISVSSNSNSGAKFVRP